MRNKKKTILIEGPVGNLEVRFSGLVQGSPMEETAGDQGRKLVVLSHPHPQFGGTMNNKVVTTLERAFQELGYDTLAYNFRGVGQSTGDYDGGEGEQQDLKAVVEWARAQVDVSHLVLAGFSFGSFVTLSAQADIQADRVLAVAPPTGLYDFSAVQEVSVPWDVVVGLDDEIVDPDEMVRWALSREQAPSLYCRANCSHFFHGELIWLKKLALSLY